MALYWTAQVALVFLLAHKRNYKTLFGNFHSSGI